MHSIDDESMKVSFVTEFQLKVCFIPAWYFATVYSQILTTVTGYLVTPTVSVANEVMAEETTIRNRCRVRLI